MFVLSPVPRDDRDPFGLVRSTILFFTSELPALKFQVVSGSLSRSRFALVPLDWQGSTQLIRFGTKGLHVLRSSQPVICDCIAFSITAFLRVPCSALAPGPFLGKPIALLSALGLSPSWLDCQPDKA